MEGVFGALWQGMSAVLAWPVPGWILAGVIIGCVFGAIPGLTASLGIILVLPFIWGLDPASACAILLSIVAAVHCSNTFPAFFFNVPGSPSAAATILDGYPMAKKGEASKGLVAAFTVSAIGGIIGAMVLCAMFPVLRPFVLAFASPERFMLVMLGIVMIGVLSGQQPIKGLLAGAFGLLLSTIGWDPQTGFPRYAFGQDYLLEGLSIVPLCLGLFALPEIMSLAVRGQIADEKTSGGGMGTGFISGMRAVLDHRFTVLRSSIIGVIGGAIPGIGGTASAFYAYGAAVRAAKDREGFGKGDIRGVIAPESANNSSQGGELIPTLAFGVPGGVTTAVLLAAFMVLGIRPGPPMLGEYLWLSFSIVFILVISNVLAAIICIGVTKWVAQVAWIRGSVLIPFVLLFVLFGGFASNPSAETAVVMLSFGALGYLMMRCEWPRVPLLIGFVLGGLAENFLFLSVASYGAAFLLRPLTLILLLLLLAVIVFGFVRRTAKT